jgi:tetratricopeptide (TPR) repeat protein
VAHSLSRDLLIERYVELAKSLRNRGQTQEARQTLILAHDLATTAAVAHPDDASIQRRRLDCANDLAWFLALEEDPQPGDPEWAVQLATLATEADPDYPVYWNTLGAALLSAGDPEGSIAAIEHAMALHGSGTAYDFLFLALAHARLDRGELARDWHRRAATSISSTRQCSRDLGRLERRVGTELAARYGAAGSVS